MSHRTIAGQRGEMTLIGLLVAMVLFLAVLGATLDVFATNERDSRNIQQRSDAQDQVRVAVDALSRQLRNLASPTPQQPQAIDYASPTDLVFQTVSNTGAPTGSNSTNVKRVRWCLATGGKLYSQQQTWTTATPPAAPTDRTCPGTGYDAGSTKVFAQNVTNQAGGLSRAVFTFNAPTTQLTSISQVHVVLDIDTDGHADTPKETVLSSGVFLRNQNKAPLSSFSWQPATPSGTALNGSDSYDPEEEPLAGYCWYAVGAPNVSSPPAPCDAGPYIGTGMTFTYTGGYKQIYLVVKDAEGLTGTSATQTIN